jgi:hypothetical protein
MHSFEAPRESLVGVWRSTETEHKMEWNPINRFIKYVDRTFQENQTRLKIISATDFCTKMFSLLPPSWDIQPRSLMLLHARTLKWPNGMCVFSLNLIKSLVKSHSLTKICPNPSHITSAIEIRSVRKLFTEKPFLVDRSVNIPKKKICTKTVLTPLGDEP